MIEDKSYGIVLKKEGSNPDAFLVVKQRNHYSFPKGHMEGEESIEETVRRELFEETGISKIEIIPDKNIVEDPYVFEGGGELYQKTNHYLFGTTSEDVLKIQEGEIYEAKFATIDEIRKLFFLKGQNLLIEKVERVLYEKD
jgi:bis(5'-nucleosidyl)-tetraphosphatase